MEPQDSGRSADALIAARAARQHGVVYREQLLAAGVSTQQIRCRVDSGRLTRLHRGVFLVGTVPPQHAVEQAALFACRPARLSHLSAAAVWELRSYPSAAPTWVTVAPDRHITRPGVIVRRAPVAARDMRRRSGLAVVCPPRAILDCAAILRDVRELEALVAEASFRGLASEDELRDQLVRNKGRPGCSALRSVLGMQGGPQRTRSGGERALLAALRGAGIGGFEANAVVHGYEVDLLWRELSCCVELDGWDGHRGRAAFERDRRKWGELQARGISVMPVSAREAQSDTPAVVGRIGAFLAAQRSKRS